jgi:uncharacterized YccA/Bax inhibitor family protein
MTAYRSSDVSLSLRSLFSVRLSGPQRAIHRAAMSVRLLTATAAVASTFLTWERWPDRSGVQTAIGYLTEPPYREPLPHNWWELGLDLPMTLVLASLVMIVATSIWALRTRRLVPTALATILSAIFAIGGLRDAIITFFGPYTAHVGPVTFYAAVVILGACAALELALVVPMFLRVRARLPWAPTGLVATPPVSVG